MLVALALDPLCHVLLLRKGYPRDVATRGSELRLTTLSHGAGCACKIGAAQLLPLIESLPASTNPDLLVGAFTCDDAAVYRLSPELAIVQTADFFTPIVDNPLDFGRIAATNALSDVYAMGARPILALNLVAYSIPKLGPEALGEILRGGAEVADAAGVALGGGHSIDDREPKYGMAVTGVVHPEEVMTNAGGRPGDELFLTKPVGGGLVTTAAKRGLAENSLIERTTTVMCELNADAAISARAAGATALTDITGFGLLGHLHELCESSGTSAQIMAESVPVIDGVLELAVDDRCVAGGTRRNAEYAETFVQWGAGVSSERRVLLNDAMTSGGLLVAVPNDRMGVAVGTRIGHLSAGQPGTVAVE
jgi:selenide, water dikinase